MSRERVKFFGKGDLINGYMLDKALTILKEIESKPWKSINDILELHNIQKYIDSGIMRSDFTDKEKLYFSESNSKLIKKIIGKFCSNIDDSNFLSYNTIELDFKEDFFDVLEKYNVYKKISGENFLTYINENNIPTFYILQYKRLVVAYDKEIKNILLNDSNSVEIFINKYFKKQQKRAINLPNSLTNEDKEKIALSFINSTYPHLGTLEILANLPVEKDFPISDETRLLAKERAELEKEKLFKNNSSQGFHTDLQVAISNTQIEPVIPASYKNGKLSISISSKWIKENLDFPTLLNNFIYLFSFVDRQMRFEYISKPNQSSVLERVFSDTELKKMYYKGYSFDLLNNFSIMQMVAYCEYLNKECNVMIEDVIQWFFDKYIVDEFGVNEFIVNMPSQGSTFLEKCRTMCSELESILKQYNLLASQGQIKHDLIEISSKPIDFDLISSIIPDKYLYINNDNLEGKRVIYWLFSDQTMLTYLPNKKDMECKYSCFYKLITHEKINFNEYEEYQQKDIESLINDNIVKMDENGYLYLANKLEISILYDIHKNDFSSKIFMEYCGFKNAVNSLIKKGWIFTKGSLLSMQECDYLDYYLNKSKFCNGHDLRNTYLHGTQKKRGEDTDLHKINYYRLLLFTVLIVIKINEELCCKDEVLKITEKESKNN